MEFHAVEVKGPKVDVLKVVALSGLGCCGEKQGAWGEWSSVGCGGGWERSLFQELPQSSL